MIKKLTQQVIKAHQFAFYLFSFLLFIIASRSNAQLVINEIQASNIRTFVDQFGEYDDWVELYNGGNSAIDLDGYGLSDDTSKPYLFTFPAYVLQPGEYIVVFASDTDITDIQTHWETAVNSNDTWSYRANTTSPPDTNWRNLSFSSSWSVGQGGVGFGDGDDGTTVPTCVSVYMRKTFSITDTSQIRSAVFNMDYDDGFVAYLNGVEIARMNIGVAGERPAWNALSTAAHEAQIYQGGNPDSFFLDKSKLKSILKNGTNVLAVEVHNQSSTNSDLTSRPWLSFLVNDGVNYFGPVPGFFKVPAKNYLHAKFKLSRAGETISLRNKNGVLLDQKSYSAIEADNSFGRNPDGSPNWCLSSLPSPGTSNNSSDCATSYTTNPVFSLSGGFYASEQSLILSTSYTGGVIRYTIDGSDVKSTSGVYTAPIRLDSTQTVRAAVFAPNTLPGPQVTNTYFIGVNTKLPVFSLTTDPVNLWDYNTGIFVKGPNAGTSNPYWGANFWQDWEKPITLEYYDRSKNRAFRFNSGMKITGGWSRSAPQKSLEIMLGDKYGQSKLNYSLEESVKPWIDKWDDFILHTTGNDRNYCKMRDPLMNRLLQTTHNDYLAYEPCMLFINGQNWGVYYIRENDDHHWIESNYGYKKDEIDLLKESYFFNGIEVKKGNDSAFFAMYEYAMNTSPSSSGFYGTMSSFMDLENMADYFIAETYYPNDDWMGGGNNNLKLWRPRKQGGKFRYLIYDLDFGLGLNGTVSNNMLAVARNASPHNYNSDLFKVLTNNSAFKKYFINRYADLMNTIFLPSNVEGMISLFRDSIKNDMHFQWQAWGSDSSTWVSKINSMITFANQRPAYAKNFVQSEFGMSSQVTLTLQVQPAGAGRIQISTITPESLPWSGVYFNGNPVNITAIPNPGYTFDHWKSNLVITQNNYNKSISINFTGNDVITCYFSGAPASPDIAFSEINYNSAGSHDAGDWIELKNNSAFQLDLSGWKFRDDNDRHVFEFPTGFTIDSGAYLILTSDSLKFSAVFPDVHNVVGNFGFDFSNGGEDLRLFNYKDSLIRSVYYQDQLPWPAGADGQGYTLENKDFSMNPNSGLSWFAGCLGGSPGGPYRPPFVSLASSGLFSICQGDSLVLQANANTTAAFQWKKDNANLNQEVSSSYTVKSAGNYQVHVTDNGCSAMSDSVRVTILPLEQVLSYSSAQRCDTGELVLNASGTSQIRWYDVPSGGNAIDTGVVFITPVLHQNTSYYVSSEGACSSPRIEVQAVVLPVSAPPVTTDSSRCGAGDIMILALDSNQIRWYDSPSGGNLVHVGSSYNLINLQNTSTFYAVAGTDCPSSRVPVTAFILPVPAKPLVTDSRHCGPDSFILSVSDTNQIRWYDAAQGGNLLASGNTFTTPVIQQTTSYYVEAGDQCHSERALVHAFVDPVAADPLVIDGSNCGPGTVSLSAVSGDTVTWYDSPGGNIIGRGELFMSPYLNTSSNFYVRAGDICPGNFVAVHAYIHDVPVPFLGNDTTISQGSSLLLDPGQGYQSYLWSNGDVTPTLTVSGNGDYAVMVTDANGCTGSDTIRVMLLTSSGQTTHEVQFQIFPNPANTTCILSFKGMDERAEIILCDMTGKLLRKEILNQNSKQMQMDVRDLSPGMYRIQYHSGNLNINKNLVIYRD